MTALLAGFVAALLLLAAIGKAAGLDEFGGYLAQLGIPRRIRSATGIAVISLETVLALAIMLRIAEPLSAWAAAVLTGAFVILQIRNVATGSAGCSCYGAVDHSLDSRLSLARASILFIATIVLALSSSASPTLLGNTLINELVGATAAATLLAAIALSNQATLVVAFDRKLRARTAAVADVQLEGELA
ncbi:MauE/DoxX family redox-associated membrane protein [Glaciihabitans sp. UYNi722]|uniref:MauE/DoxX family redox-associated membrane protein n=1 Tax=Glaciihabitans sp. UYNi722 TaxID=3156344 RepID=UPI003390E663